MASKTNPFVILPPVVQQALQLKEQYDERLYQEALIGLRAPGFNKKEFFRILRHTNPSLFERLKREGW